MIKSVKVRLFPNKEQEQLLWKHINISRFVWNFGLAYQLERFKNGQKHLSGYDLRKMFTELKQQEEYVWLKEISAHTISNVCLDLDDAYKRFFKKISGKPKFKKKNKCKNAFPLRQDSFYLDNNCARIEKIGKVKYQTNYNLPQGIINQGKFTNPRIKYENNKWILTFGIEFNKQEYVLTDNSMGIDLGIKDLCVVSYGTQYAVFKNINKTKGVKKLKKQIKHAQRKVSKKYDANKSYDKSNNIIKAEKRVKKLHNKLSNIRKDYIHQITRKLVNMLPNKIVMEDLNVSGMMKNRHLSKAIQEQCFAEFIRQIKYKCEEYGIKFIQADRFYPSSKTCACCGFINKDLKLKDRVYICPDCGFEIDRDLNASINLMNYKG
jgi:putative transposase